MARRGRPATGYVESRGGGWGFRFTVPPDVRAIIGTAKVRKPLKAKTVHEARSEAAPLAVEYNSIVARLRALPPSARPQVAIERYWSDKFNADDALNETHFERPALEARLRAARAKQAFLDALAESNMATHPVLAMGRAAEKVLGLELRDDDVQTLPSEAASLSADIQRQLMEGAQVEHRRLRENAKAADGRLDAALAKLGLGTNARAATNDIMSAFDRWTATVKQEPQTVRKHRVHVRRLSELFADCNVAQLTAEHVERYLEAVRAMPDTRFLKVSERDQSIQKLIGIRKARPELPPIGDVTVRKAYETVHAFLRFCKNKSAADIDQKPKVGRKKKKDRRKDITPNEWASLLPRLEQKFGSQSDIAWWVHALIYSGSRPEEIAQLDRANVRQEQGLWVFDINEENGRRTKNQNSVRVVPIHPRLIARGFIEFATKGKGVRVFGSFERDSKGYYGANPARRVIRFMRLHGIDDSRKVLYSVRHAFHTAMRKAGVPYDVQLALVGREDDENPVHGDYGETLLSEKARWMAKVEPLAD